MSENNKRHHRREYSRRTLQFAVGAFCFGAFGARTHAANEFTPRLDVYTSWTDNVTLVSDNDPTKREEYIGQINPGFLWKQKSQRFEMDFEYRMQNLFYFHDSDENSTYHQGNLNATAELLREYFFLDASATYSQQLIDPEAPISGSNVFLTKNTADALTAQIAPSLRHEFDTVYVDARYSRGIIDYKSHENGGNADSLQDAEIESIRSLLSNPEDPGRKLTWAASYNSEIARYDNAPDFRYDEAHVELGFLVGKDVRLIGRYGSESDPSLDQSKGGLDSETWEAGFQWRPGRRTNVEGYYGERFFGPTYRAIISHEAQRVVVDASYSEGPLTQAQELASQQQTFGTVVPGQNYFSRPTAEAFVYKMLAGSVRIKGQRTDITIGVTDYKRTYLDANLNAEHSQGGSLEFSRALSSRSRFELGGYYSQTDLREGNDYRDVNFRVEFNRQLSERVKAALTGRSTDRSGDFNYDAIVVTVSLQGEF